MNYAITLEESVDKEWLLSPNKKKSILWKIKDYLIKDISTENVSPEDKFMQKYEGKILNKDNNKGILETIKEFTDKKNNEWYLDTIGWTRILTEFVSTLIQTYKIDIGKNKKGEYDERKYDKEKNQMQIDIAELIWLRYWKEVGDKIIKDLKDIQRYENWLGRKRIITGGKR